MSRNEDAISKQTSRVISTKWGFSDDEIKEVKTKKTMNLQADPKKTGRVIKDC